MNAEELLVLAGTARSTDFKRVAGGATNEKGRAARARRRSKDELKEANGRPLYDSVIGHQTRVARAPVWSVAELGQALAGVPRLPTLAALYCAAGDDSPGTYWGLYRGLRSEAWAFEEGLHWPHTVIGRDGLPRLYLESITQLVLDEERNSPIFREHPHLNAAYLHVEEPVWKFRLYERFDLLRVRFQGWRDMAMALANRKTSSRDPVDEEIAALMQVDP